MVTITRSRFGRAEIKVGTGEIRRTGAAKGKATLTDVKNAIRSAGRRATGDAFSSALKSLDKPDKASSRSEAARKANATRKAKGGTATRKK